jgi:hypothetical protein
MVCLNTDPRTAWPGAGFETGEINTELRLKRFLALLLNLVNHSTGQISKAQLKTKTSHDGHLQELKPGAVIIRNTRRVRVLMSDADPYKDELSALVRRLVPD